MAVPVAVSVPGPVAVLVAVPLRVTVRVAVPRMRLVRRRRRRRWWRRLRQLRRLGELRRLRRPRWSRAIAPGCRHRRRRRWNRRRRHRGQRGGGRRWGRRGGPGRTGRRLGRRSRWRSRRRRRRRGRTLRPRARRPPALHGACRPARARVRGAARGRVASVPSRTAPAATARDARVVLLLGGDFDAGSVFRAGHRAGHGQLCVDGGADCPQDGVERQAERERRNRPARGTKEPKQRGRSICPWLDPFRRNGRAPLSLVISPCSPRDRLLGRAARSISVAACIGLSGEGFSPKPCRMTVRLRRVRIPA